MDESENALGFVHLTLKIETFYILHSNSRVLTIETYGEVVRVEYGYGLSFVVGSEL